MGNCFSSSGDGDDSHKLRDFEPVRYLSDPAGIRSEPVQGVHFVADTVLQSGGNHWIMFLQTSRPNGSVRINMLPSSLRGARAPGHGFRGHLEISTWHDAASRQGHQFVTMPAVPGRTAADFINAIINTGNHEYDFTTEGRGCTGWMLDQYRLFAQQGLIHPGFDAIESAITLEWVNGRPTSERQVTRGFYMRDTRGGGWSRRGGSNGSKNTGRSHRY